MFIYRITNLSNGKVYIGYDTGVVEEMRRWHCHIKNGKKPEYESKIWHAIQKYGVENFECDVIDHAQDIHELWWKETFWIHAFDSIKRGYNIFPGGNGFPPLNECTPEEREYFLSIMRKGAVAANKARWSKATDEDRRQVGETMKRGWTGKNRSKVVSSNWAKLTKEEKDRKLSGLRKTNKWRTK